MPAMHAYLDDFGKIIIWMNKNFYGGRSDYFSLVEGSSSQDLVVVNAEEHDTKMKYDLSLNKLNELKFEYNKIIKQFQVLILILMIQIIYLKILFHYFKVKVFLFIQMNIYFIFKLFQF